MSETIVGEAEINGTEPSLVGLEGVLATDELYRRPRRATDHAAENRALVTLMEELGSSTGNVLQRLVEIAIELCDAESAGVSILEDDNGRSFFRWHAVTGQWSGFLGGTMPREFSPCGTVLDRNSALLMSHPQRHFPFPPDIAPPITEVLLIPFHAGGEPVGTVWLIAHSAGRQFDEEDVRLLTSLSRFASAAYQMLTARKHLYERERALSEASADLRESEERFSRFMQHLPGLAWIKDRDGRYVFVNDAAERAFRRSRSELSGKTDEEIFPSPTAAHFRGHDQQVLDNQSSIEVVETLEHDDGLHYSLVNKFPIPAPDGTVALIGGMAIDITERRRAEQRLATQFAVTRLLAEAATLEEIGPRILEAICETADWQLGALWRTDKDANVLRCAELWRRRPQEVSEFERETFRRTFPPGVGLPGRVWRNRAPAWISDVTQDDNFPRAPFATSEGLHGAFAFPFGVRDEVFGVMEFFSPQVREPDPDFLQMTSAIGTQVGQFVERKQAAEALNAVREQLQLVTDSMELAVVHCSADHRYVWTNRAYTRLVGRSLREIAGQRIEDVLGRDVYEMILPHIERVLAGEKVEFETRVKYSGAGERWVKAAYVPTYGHSSVPDGWVAVVNDITDEKQREEIIRNSERLYRAIGESINYGVWVCDPAGRNTYASESFLKLVGMTQEECSHFGWGKVLHPDDVEATIAAWQECVRSGGHWDQEHRFRGSDGRWHSILARGVPVRNEQGEVTAWAGINLDISRLKQVENELRDADRRKDEFLATLAHELRNPLAPILNGLELMRLAGNERALVEEVRATMGRQARQMVRLVDDLLDISRITRGRVELKKNRVELRPIIESAVEASRPIIEEWEHDLTISLPKEPVVLEADATRLAQVFSNLLNNAAKYMQPRGHIVLKAERRDAGAVVTVKDTGIGIPTEMLDRIFDLFMQVDRSLERSHSGLGIGLTLVKRLVEMHGGSVEARSAGAGQGSEFIVRLPLARGDTAESPPVRVEDVCNSPRLRVLVVDDNNSAATMLSLLLRALGNEVQSAGNGFAALAAAAEFRPELIFLDIGMPGLSGYDTARRIRAEAWGRDITLVALTGWGQEEDKRRSREAGFDYHFVKPIEPDALQRVLAERRAQC